MRIAFMVALGRIFLPGLLTASAALASAPAVTVSVDLDASGTISVTSTTRKPGLALAPVMASVIGCPGPMSSTPEDVFGHFRCPNGLRRDGLQLEGVFN